MGIFDRFFSRQQSDAQILDFYIKDTKKQGKLKFKETLDINDQILDMYKEKHHEDIQQDILNKYLKQTQDQINFKLVEQNEIKEEVNNLEGVSKEDKEKIQAQMEAQEQEGKTDDGKQKDKKKALRERVYQTAYMTMYKDYTEKVMGYKDAQLTAGAVALGEKEAVELLAYEKNLEKMELMYYNSAGKNFSKVEKIQDKREEFKDEFRYTQKGIEMKNEDLNMKINKLYLMREEKYREYIDALTDPTKSPQEVYMYKKDYEKANMQLINQNPALCQYVKQLGVQKESEEIAEKQGLENKTAINERISYDKNIDGQNVTEGKTAELLEHTEENKEKREKLSEAMVDHARKEEFNKGNYEVAKEVSNVKGLNDELSLHTDDEKVGKTEYKKDAIKAQETIRENEKQQVKEQDEFDDFRSMLSGYNNTGMTAEKAQKEEEYEAERLEEERRKEAMEKAQQVKEDEMVIERKKNNNHN